MPTRGPTRAWRCWPTTTTTPTGARCGGSARTARRACWSPDEAEAGRAVELLAARYAQYRETPPRGAGARGRRRALVGLERGLRRHAAGRGLRRRRRRRVAWTALGAQPRRAHCASAIVRRGGRASADDAPGGRGPAASAPARTPGPGARDDPHRVALVLEGGGMRGVVSAGMAAALERLDLTRCLDLVVGASAGRAERRGPPRRRRAGVRGGLRRRLRLARVRQPRPAAARAPGARRRLRPAARERRARPRAPRPHDQEPDPAPLPRGRRRHGGAGGVLRHAHGGGAVGRPARHEPDALGRRRPDRDRRPALPRRRPGGADPRRRGRRGRRHARAGAPDPPVRRAPHHGRAVRGPRDRAPPAAA